MSAAAAERAALAEAGRDLAKRDRRVGALLGTLTDAPPKAFATLLDAPEWLRWPEERRRRLAEVVALRSVAPSLARSIDGAWLGALAEVAGDEAVDWAMARGAGDEFDGSGEPGLSPDALARRGSAILSGALPVALRSYLRAGASDPVVVREGVVDDALAFVGEREQ